MRTIPTAVTLVFVLASSVAVQELHASYLIERVQPPASSAPRMSAARADALAPENDEEAAGFYQNQSDFVAPRPLRNPAELSATGSMVGRVIDRHDGRGLVHLSVLATHQESQERHETRTDSHGEFQFHVLSGGNFRVRVGRPGQQQEFDGVRVVSDRVTMLNFRISQ